jgi:nucleotide-binding universal stress UspA family protein
MIFQKILVAVDGSEHSQRALDKAVEIAKSVNGMLLVFMVHQDTVAPVTNPEMAVHMAGTIPDGPSPVLADMANQAAHEFDEKFLAKAEAKVKASGVQVHTELVEGDPADEIVKRSKEGFDLIVLGARGAGRLSKLFLGSVSDGVIKKASCPVLVVK